MKTICMIPARLGSKRIPRKNLRILNGKPLIAYAIEAAKESGVFDEIYLNSEDEIFRQIAEEYGIKFYKRDEELASDTATNDQFAYDFIKNVKCDNLFQLLCTSPFISAEYIRQFFGKFTKDNLDTLIAVKPVQIECMYNNKTINFLRNDSTQPSQSLTPVMAYGCSCMMWKATSFEYNYVNALGAYHGGSKRTGYFPVVGYMAIDIDNEEDFVLAEMIAKSLTVFTKVQPQYYGESKSTETDVPTILQRDGVKNNDLFASNDFPLNINEVIAGKPKNESWSHRVVNCDNVSATLIAQMQGESNRRHSHPHIGEFWIIVKGKYVFEIGALGEEVITAQKDEIVYLPANTIHRIVAIGDDGLNIRFAVSKDNAEHVYTN